jgi:hypothetical protein
MMTRFRGVSAMEISHHLADEIGLSIGNLNPRNYEC